MAEIAMYGEMSREVAGHVSRRLLKRKKARIYTERFAQARELPKKHGKTINFRRYLALNLAVAPLAEGITPAGQKPRYEDVVARLEQYGDCLGITDVIQDTHHDPILKEMTNLCNDQIVETIETIRFAVLKSGTNVFYAGGVSARTSIQTTPQRGDFRKIERSLNRNRAEKITSVVKASQKISTQPVEPAYYNLLHVDLKPDLEDLQDFVAFPEYSNSDKALEGEIGACGAHRFLASDLYDPWLAAATGVSTTAFLSNGVEPSSAANPDVYPIITLAKDAYAAVRLQGENAVTPIVINPKPSAADPLGQRGWVGWKMWQCCVILNQLWMARYEVACTANPS